MATRTVHVSDDIDFTHEERYFTQRCGFTVMFSLTGPLKATLILDDSGLVISEIDTQPGTTVRYWTPAGKSFSFPFADILQTDYPGGAKVGGSAVARGGGLVDKFPCVSAEAGFVFFYQATVLAILTSGAPLVDRGPITRSSGKAVDPNAIDAAVCAALRG